MSLMSYSVSTAALPTAVEERATLEATWHRLGWGEAFSNPITDLHVTPQVALTFSAYFSAINILSSDIANLPIVPMRSLPDGSSEILRDHPVSYLGWSGVSPASKPVIDGESVPFKVQQAAQAKTLGEGNSYLRIMRDSDGNPVEVRLLQSAEPKRRVKDGGLYYLTDTGKTLPSYDVIHMSGLGGDGLSGYSIAKQAKESIILGKAMETFGVSFFGNSSTPSGFLEHPGKLSPEARKNLQESFEDMHRGVRKAFRVAVLSEGMKFSPYTVNPEDAQFLASRQFQVIEICRWFRLPPHKLMDYTQSHLANIESSNLDYLTSTLFPWLRIWAQELTKKLFTAEERAAGYFIAHDFREFLKADAKSRGEYYKNLFMVGAASPNDIRRFEGQNGYDNGDKYYVPVNMRPTDVPFSVKDATQVPTGQQPQG